jgi:hypothetical protein
MGKLEIIEHDIAALTAAELAQFRDWFARFDAENWERQIAQDAESGKLDALAQRAESAHRAGKTTAL